MNEKKVTNTFRTPALHSCPGSFKNKVLDTVLKMKNHIISRNGNPYIWGYDDFEIGAYLGRGCIGRVYLARDKYCHVPVALKLLHKSDIIKNKLERQVSKEINIHIRLKHPNILKMFTYFDDDRFVFFVLEYVSGGELSAKQRTMPGYRFPEKQAAKYVYEVSDALKYIHEKNIIHRDIKPENILLTSNDDVKLSDFGWSTRITNHKRRAVVGTLDYLPPEMVALQPHDGKVDNWCVGVLCYEILVGKPPFQGSSDFATREKIKTISYTIPNHVSPPAKSFIQKLLLRNPDDRISFAEIMVHPWIESNYKPQPLK